MPYIIYFFMRVIWRTIRKETHYLTPKLDEQSVIVSWHGELFLFPHIYRAEFKKREASAIVSTHSDGSIIANIIEIMKIKPLRGSTRHGAASVLKSAFKAVKNGDDMLITPDGPKGPRHYMNDGPAGIAIKSKLPIMVMSYKCSNYWQFNSWDKFVIPKPFSKVDIYIQSISIDGQDMETAKGIIKSKMLENTIL